MRKPPATPILVEMGPTDDETLAAVCEKAGVSLADIEHAENVISRVARETPVLTSGRLNKFLSDSGTLFYCKAELFQKTGSFKFRGAYNAVAALNEASDSTTPVVTHSSGNHGQALACAGQLLSRRVFVVVPDPAPQVKVDAIKSYGATVVRCEPTLEKRMETAKAVVEREQGILIHPFLHRSVVAGQGTIALEFLRQVPDLDAIIASIGGGGMISGVAIAAKALKPSIRIIGAEPTAADAAARSLETGSRVGVPGVVKTVADGVKMSIGELGWGVVSGLVDRVIRVSEEDIVRATKFVWETMKVVIEPSAGLGVAAAGSKELRALGLHKVGIILCGGNVDISNLPW